jgi:hypothetical protein
MNVFQREANTLQFIENYHNDLADREECRENRDKCNGMGGERKESGIGELGIRS